MWQRWALPCVLIVPASLALWMFAPRISILSPSYRHAAIVPAVAALLILAYAVVAARLASVQCRADHISLQAPFHPLALSYARIKSVRPKRFTEVFDLVAEKPARQRWLWPYIGATVIVVELTSYPLPKPWLQLWFSPYVMDPKTAGFVFLVDDWLALSRQIDACRIARRMAHARPRGATRLTSLM
jgi:hypothetical protein